MDNHQKELGWLKPKNACPTCIQRLQSLYRCKDLQSFYWQMFHVETRHDCKMVKCVGLSVRTFFLCQGIHVNLSNKVLWLFIQLWLCWVFPGNQAEMCLSLGQVMSKICWNHISTSLSGTIRQRFSRTLCSSDKDEIHDHEIHDHVLYHFDLMKRIFFSSVYIW